MKLAEQLGSFAGQLTETGIRAVEIEYEGAIAELNIKPLTAIALDRAAGAAAGDRQHGQCAADLPRARHPGQRDAARRAGDYQTLMRVTVTTERRQRSVAGTLFAGNRPRLVDIEGIPLEAELGRHMLFVRNKDKPGFIGDLGRTLGEASVNIATFHLGRTAPGEDAICLVEVDQKLTPALLDAVRRLPNVIQAKAMRF